MTEIRVTKRNMHNTTRKACQYVLLKSENLLNDVRGVSDVIIWRARRRFRLYRPRRFVRRDAITLWSEYARLRVYGYQNNHNILKIAPFVVSGSENVASKEMPELNPT